ncbi:uncharacterized protein KD926_007876 [Aspergillus affinis]|uniref:uncharacterized protein n=1 Tax=Aspergillus affinis TaxID=1070780 RepID=UPI0022FDF117|nr:uncharacterized protein KD926_007876 [Aspergillus affinis]KAI9040660.1 hypothetical protein KD926_007876 [Aspergillus affinis]
MTAAPLQPSRDPLLSRFGCQTHLGRQATTNGSHLRSTVRTDGALMPLGGQTRPTIPVSSVDFQIRVKKHQRHIAVAARSDAKPQLPAASSAELVGLQIVAFARVLTAFQPLDNSLSLFTISSSPMATGQLMNLDVVLHHRGLSTMSEDNVDRGTIPLRVRDSVTDPAPGSPSMPSSRAHDIDIAKSPVIPPLSGTDSPGGSSTTNRAHHSASVSLSNETLGAVPKNFVADDLNEQTGDLVNTRVSADIEHSSQPNSPTTSRTSPDNHPRNAGVASGIHQSRVSPDSPGDSTGRAAARLSRLDHRRNRSSPALQDRPRPNLNHGQQAFALPRRSRLAAERLTYGQESAQNLSNEHKFVRRFAAASEGTASCGILLEIQDAEPVTEYQLSSEVRIIFSGIAKVEKRCSEYIQDGQKMAVISPDKWHAMLTAHQILLQEHHDFYMASQHPSSIPSLGRRISEKYAMSIRIWRYGIHAFLELLRSRLPDSLEPMLTFIYYAYSMMTLFLETVPSYEETWIEYLGDLSKYRMAVDESNLHDREIWGGVAKYWYNKAADRNPDVGRIQHHLAVAARPDIVQQLFYFTKSLISVRPCQGTREIFVVLFNPLLKDPRVVRYPQVMAGFVTAHGYLFGRNTSERFFSAAENFLSGLDNYIPRVGGIFKMQGVYIAASNFAAMLEYGSTNALLSNEFRLASTTQSRPLEDIDSSVSRDWTSVNDPQKVADDFLALDDPESPSRLIYYGSYLAFQTFSIFLDQIGDKNIYAALHLSLAFLWCLTRTSGGMKYAELVVPWRRIVAFLNTMFSPLLDMSLVEKAEFPISDETKWIPEDFLIRGHIWSQVYYPPSFFEGSPTEDDGRNIEMPSLKISRMYRCLWLGVRLAKFDRWMTYDSILQKFSVTPFALELERLAEAQCPFHISTPQEVSSADVEMRGS